MVATVNPKKVKKAPSSMQVEEVAKALKEDLQRSNLHVYNNVDDILKST